MDCPLSLRYHLPMPKASFAHVETWIFDLDNTLYPADTALFDQISARMTTFVMRELGLGREEASSLRNRYWRSHGTTLAGLIDLHGLAPEPFMEEVHDIDFSVLTPAPHLAAAIEALPGRKIVYTNGSKPYARRVTEALALTRCFETFYGVEDASYRPKPERAAFEQVFALDGLTPTRAAMFEDDIRNLAAPHEMGLATVLVGDGEAPHVHFSTTDLAGFLSRLV
jgi:putative hydrolase of the HAD superfamily